MGAGFGPLLSIVVPLYRSSGTARELVHELHVALAVSDVTYEIVLVDDRSPDDVWSIVTDIVSTDARVVGLRLTRNFGQHHAIMAGLEASRGEWIVVMDADLQDPPAQVPELLEAALASGVDVVLAQDLSRGSSVSQRFTSRVYQSVMAGLADIHVPRGVGTFGVYSRRVIDAVISIPDRDFVFPALVQWVGLPVKLVPLRRAGKRGGHSSYNLKRRVRLAARAIVWNSNKVLRMSAWVGLVLAVISIGYAAYLVVNYSITGASVPGWTSLMVVVLFVGGLILSSNGIMGVYLGAVFDSSKQRPRHLVAHKIGGESE